MGLWASLRVLFAPASVRAERGALRSRLEVMEARLAALRPDERARLAARARALDSLRARIVALTGAPSACRTCSTRQPGTDPRFPGGFCCGGGTKGVFGDGELVALRLRGARLMEARVTTAHAGCVFRTPERGCTLAPEDRPGICLAYACTELKTELAARGGTVMKELAEVGEELEREIRMIDEEVARQGKSGDPNR